MIVLGSATVLRGDARHLPLPDNSVDLVVTSPPYFALRSYQDGGEHYDGQIGDEPTPAEFVDSLLEVTAECVRVLKPSGSLWVNLGDKYASSGGHGAGATSQRASRSQYVEQIGRSERNTSGVAIKSLMGIPWRYALACIDDLGLILRAEVIWSKPNGLPESVTDRVRRSHEQWFHFTLSPRYYSAVDEIREPHVSPNPGQGGLRRRGDESYHALSGAGATGAWDSEVCALGKLPGSVWTIPTEPLRVPDHLGIDHFAAFPSEWPKRIIQGWSPAGVCVECGEGRRPVREVLTGETEMRRALTDSQSREWCGRFQSWCRENGVSRAALARASGTGDMGARWWGVGGMPAVPTPEHWPLLRQAWPHIPSWFDEYVYSLTEVPKRERKPRDIGGGKDQYSFDSRHNPAALGITGYACACGIFDSTPGNHRLPDPASHVRRSASGRDQGASPDASEGPGVAPPTRPAVVLDPFGGTGTTATVAKALGRHGITVDMSADYCRLAEWRTNDRNQLAKVLDIPKIKQQDHDQLDLLALMEGD